MNPSRVLPIPPARRALAALGVSVLAVVLMVATAGAQTGFKVTHAVSRVTPTHAEVTGAVTNETRTDAIDVSVTVEAVGAGGKAVARGIAYVTPRLPAGTGARFSAKVPVVDGVTGYRASVTSFRFVPGFAESP